MVNLVAAIGAYDTAYSRLPGVSATAGQDMTYGYPAGYPVSPGANAVPTNSDVMSILMDIPVGINTNHAKNPQNIVSFTAKQNSDTNSPGLSTIDNQLRDPWGTPYVITLDLNGDGYCQDAFYGNPSVSQNGSSGYNGLQNYLGGTPSYQLRAPVMIWSFGPDKGITNNPANTTFNQDNVLSWQ
jgi:hypothetical protein